MRKRLVTAITFALIILCGLDAEAVTPSDYLILQSIGNYHNSGKGRCGNGAGFLAAAGHFRIDHNDTTCDADYYNVAQDVAVDIQVTQHVGSDSDKWLLHEVEDGYRDSDKLNETVDAGVQMKTLNGNNVYFSGIYGGKSYTWIGNNSVVVEVSCSSCPNTKPEPLEVVNAYLEKYPSIITLTDSDLKSQTHSVQWIKGEMDRRLWLCDKWFYQLQLGKVSQNEVLQEAVKSMNIFLDYREKYYGIKAADEKNLLTSYLNTNNGTGIKTKLAEYKTWWTVNKEKGISL